MLHKRRWYVCVVAVLGAAVSMAFAPIPPPKAPEKAPTAKEELGRLQGTWRHVSCSYEGEPAKEEPAPNTYRIKGEEYAQLADGKPLPAWSLVIDPSKRPRVLDLVKGPYRLRGIYRLEGDTLTVCHTNNLHAKERPADFRPRKGVVIDVYKRVKKKP